MSNSGIVEGFKGDEDLPVSSNGAGYELPGELDDVELNPNYRDNWTQLLYDRVPENRNKLRLFKEKYYPEDLETSLKEFDVLTADINSPVSIFNSTEYISADEAQKQTHNVGIGKYGDKGTVFKDATDKFTGLPLNSFHKNIAESHEKAHGMFNMYSPSERARIMATFDLNAVPDELGLRKYPPDKLVYEYMARMSQLKNYFGFKGGEKFTKEHLDYARKNYILDTGWDNNMSDFFRMITPNKEAEFLRLINELPC